MPRRPIIPRNEADAILEIAVQRKDEHGCEDLRFVKLLGLYTWNPDCGATSVFDTNRPYFFWVYQYEEIHEFPMEDERTTSPMYFLVGSDMKGGCPVIDQGFDDICVEVWHDRKEMMRRMKKFKPEHAKEFGLSIMELISTMV